MSSLFCDQSVFDNPDDPMRIIDEHYNSDDSFMNDCYDSHQTSSTFPTVPPLHNDYTFEELSTITTQIRLMSLAPSVDSTAAIYCKLETVSLSPTLKYKALSYVWGSEENRHDIFIQGRRFKVTSNLHNALVHLRHPARYRIFWIDAICINQSNDAEKNQQIPLVREIYLLASRVLIWFGDSDDDIDKVLAYFKYRDQTKDSEVLALPEEEDKQDEMLPGINKLFFKPWFRRIWVVQEVLIAQKEPIVGCGQYWVSWTNFTTLMPWFSTLHMADKGIQTQVQPAALSGFFQLYMTFQPRRVIENFEHLLISTADREAKLPKDKVFAVLGLASQGVRRTIKIDYSSSTKTSVVFEQAMVKALEGRPDLEFLRLAVDNEERSDPDLPSWCIDFSRPSYLRHIRGLRGMPRDIYVRGAAGWAPHYNPIYNQVQRSLSIEGIYIGKITNVVPGSKCLADDILCRSTEPTDLEISLWAEKILEYIILCSMAFLNAYTAVGKSEAALKLLFAGEIWRTISHNEASQIVESALKRQGFHITEQQCYGLMEFWSYAAYGISPWWKSHAGTERIVTAAKILEEEGLCIIVKCALQRLNRDIPKHSFIVTDNLYMASSSGCVKKGDILCLLLGCSKPAVLRPVEFGQSGVPLFKLVGFTWTHGVMGGELVRDGAYQMQLFTLK